MCAYVRDAPVAGMCVVRVIKRSLYRECLLACVCACSSKEGEETVIIRTNARKHDKTALYCIKVFWVQTIQMIPTLKNQQKNK